MKMKKNQTYTFVLFVTLKFRGEPRKRMGMMVKEMIKVGKKTR